MKFLLLLIIQSYFVFASESDPATTELKRVEELESETTEVTKPQTIKSLRRKFELLSVGNKEEIRPKPQSKISKLARKPEDLDAESEDFKSELSSNIPKLYENLQAKDAEIKSLKYESSSKITKLNEKLKAKDKEINGLKLELLSNIQIIDKQEQELKSKNSLVGRITESNRLEIAELNKQIFSLQTEISVLKEKINSQDPEDMINSMLFYKV